MFIFLAKYVSRLDRANGNVVSFQINFLMVLEVMYREPENLNFYKNSEELLRTFSLDYDGVLKKE